MGNSSRQPYTHCQDDHFPWLGECLRFQWLGECLRFQWPGECLRLQWPGECLRFQWPGECLRFQWLDECVRECRRRRNRHQGEEAPGRGEEAQGGGGEEAQGRKGFTNRLTLRINDFWLLLVYSSPFQTTSPPPAFAPTTVCGGH